MNGIKTTKGFTIIEVVLVLAIAGLIFLMVFIALPALQSGQRDQARKNDVSSIASAVNTYTGNNRGQWPTTNTLTGSTTGEPTNGKFGGYSEAVSTNTISITVQSAVITTSTNVTVTEGQIIITKQSRCSAAGKATNGDPFYTVNRGTARQFSVITYVEAGGGTAFCQDS